MSQSFFAVISDEKEKTALLHDIATLRALLHVRPVDTTAREFFMEALEYSHGRLRCTPDKSATKISSSGSLLASVTIPKGKYFSIANYKLKDGVILLDTHQRFFLLQRRADFRLMLPQEVEARLRVTALNDVPTCLSFVVNHLSASGCGIINPAYELHEGMTLSGELELPFGKIRALTGRVRHLSPADPFEPLLVGLSFEALSEARHSELQNCVEEIYKRFYIHLYEPA